jgi:hypothetical protein
MRLIDEQAVEHIALGAAVLGTGGGGNPYLGTLMARAAIRRYGPVELYTLDEMDDDDLVVPSAGMGAPTVTVEKMPNGENNVRAFKALEQYLGKPIKATMSIEAGGGNSISPMYVATRLGIPMLDCDGMGRAFPEIQMVTMTIHGISATPMALSDERGNIVFMETVDNRWTETLARTVTIDMGAASAIALYAATVGQLKEAAVTGTITQAEQIGQTIRRARIEEDNPVDTICKAVNGFLLFRGKIADIQRRTTGGFARGDAHLSGIDEHAGKTCLINFQNEHLIAKVDDEFKATVPDLIAVLDIDTGEPITTEMLRYGMRVAVIAFPCSEKWRTPKGLELVGPRYFGYDTDYVPVEEKNA